MRSQKKCVSIQILPHKHPEQKTADDEKNKNDFEDFFCDEPSDPEADTPAGNDARQTPISALGKISPEYPTECHTHK
jgi:hypothetical protein